MEADDAFDNRVAWQSNRQRGEERRIPNGAWLSYSRARTQRQTRVETRAKEARVLEKSRGGVSVAQRTFHAKVLALERTVSPLDTERDGEYCLRGVEITNATTGLSSLVTIFATSSLARPDTLGS